MEIPSVWGPGGRLKTLRQICHLATADFAKLFLIMCQIASECQKSHHKNYLNVYMSHRAERSLETSFLLHKFCSSTVRLVLIVPSQQHNHWIAACLNYQHVCARTHTQTPVCGVSVKPQ